MEFETRPVSEIPRSSHAPSGFSAAFAELPIGLAMFVQGTGETPLRKQDSRLRSILKPFRGDRRIHTRLDHSKAGVWLWWEPKEQS